ncbi:autotransporter outer membrane beta-barrel domain-containing protein [Budvicia aquatica]|uniref:Autotransporter outer membrane beta-barrel domain-containing protein n=1 Tax=Budvicia aquatica TaxID=82979 RepID=A0A2C6CR94_9GAMM|nr:autotransporter outer membrane beta-barrel domain-containing protein [Budvicia aquatica]PHI29199.1 autotransporter outer membrane beta-barrel domain-containing protein [Budvicia aquatica]
MRFNPKLPAAGGEGRQESLAGVLEPDYRYSLAQAIFINPYARAGYFHADGKSISLSNSMTVHLDNHRSAKGEIGVILSQSPYLGRGKLERYYSLTLGVFILSFWVLSGSA